MHVVVIIVDIDLLPFHFMVHSTLDARRTSHSRCNERPASPTWLAVVGCGVVVVDERTDGVWVLTWNLNWSCFLVIEMECTVPPYVDKFKLTLI